MPVIKVTDPKGEGRTCYRWGGSGKIYCGMGAKGKAVKQGVAAVLASGKKPGDRL